MTRDRTLPARWTAPQKNSWAGRGACEGSRGPCTMKACEHIAALLHISLLTFAEYYPTPTHPYAPL